MALLQVNYYSNALCRFNQFQMILANDVPELLKQNSEYYNRPMKTVILLHGYSGSNMDWMTGSNVNELAVKYNLAIVMPNADNSFYLNAPGSGNKYQDLIEVDLINYLRDTFGLAKNPEDTIIGGLSMGGFGAIRFGLHRPDLFGKMFGLSSAMIVNEISKMPADAAGNAIADRTYYENVFGDLSKLKESENDPEFLVKQRLAKGEKIQPIYMACGTEDFLLGYNRDFYNFLKENGVDVEMHESTGIHEWKFWNEYLEPSLRWALELDK